jgi:hypothetical protein
MKQYQVAHGTWEGLKGEVSEVKRFWTAAEPK